MAPAQPAHQMDVQGLADRCREHEKLFRQDSARSDPQFCFELFRRALAEKSQQAWTCIVAQYHDQVERWILSFRAIPGGYLDLEDFVNEAFFRFWRAPAVIQILRRPPAALSQLLQYLKKCAISAVLDAARRPGSQTEPLSLDEMPRPTRPADVRSLENLFDQREAVSKIHTIFRDSLKTQEEEIVFLHRFTLNQKAAAIQREFPDIFPDAARVHRVTENLLKRFRRIGDLREALAAHDSKEELAQGGKMRTKASLKSNKVTGNAND